MGTTLLNTQRLPFQKVRSVNQTSNGYVSKIPTGTTPFGDAGTATGASIIECGGPGSVISDNAVVVLFYGTGSNDNTFSCRLIGWRVVGAAGSTANINSTMLWIPVPLFEVAVTLSSTNPGIAGRTIVATELFADTIAITGTTANSGVSIDVVSPANNTVAHLTADFKGFEKIEFSFTTGGSATDCNALYAFI